MRVKKQVKVLLIYRGSDQSLRVVTKPRPLAMDEVAWRITLDVPGPWGQIAGQIDINLPEAPPTVEVTEMEHGGRPAWVTDKQEAPVRPGAWRKTTEEDGK